MNRDRWIQLAVIAALLALAVWFARHTYWDEVTVMSPPRGEAALNPYYAVAHLAEGLGVHTRMIGSLHALPVGTIVLVNHLSDDLRREPIESLQAWVQSGGRLIIGADTLNGSEPLKLWSGIKPLPRGSAAVRAGYGKLRAAREPEDACRPMAVSVDGVQSGRSLVLCDASPGGLSSERVPSWSLADSGAMQVLRVPIGHGELTVIGPPLMSNRSLLRRDHAQIFVAAAGLKHGDRLEILSRTRAEPLPALLWRLAAPAIVLLCVAAVLTIVRYLPRFGPPIPVQAPIRRSLAEQIRAHARFAWRTRQLTSLHAALRRALDEAAQRQLVGYTQQKPRERAETLAAHTGIDAETINAALLSDSSATVNEHRAAITLLDACRRILTRSDPSQRHPV